MRILRDMLMITIGSFLMAFGVKEFIVPAHLITSGLAGICVLFYNVFHWPIGVQFFLMNIPLLSLGYWYVGRRFTLYTLIAVFEQSAMMSLFQTPHHFTNDPLLAGLFGGIAVGFGAGLMLRFDGSGGGFDIIGRVLARYGGIGFGTTNLVLNSLIVLASIFVFDVEAALYTLISIYVASRTYDVVLHHIDKISLVIMTNHAHEVAQGIRSTLHVEPPMYRAKDDSQYRNQHEQVLYCVIVNNQLPMLKQLVLNVDEDAIISVIPTMDVVGKNIHRW